MEKLKVCYPKNRFYRQWVEVVGLEKLSRQNFGFFPKSTGGATNRQNVTFFKKLISPEREEILSWDMMHMIEE
jgi:hypothetical protein